MDRSDRIFIRTIAPVLTCALLSGCSGDDSAGSESNSATNTISEGSPTSTSPTATATNSATNSATNTSTDPSGTGTDSDGTSPTATHPTTGETETTLGTTVDPTASTTAVTVTDGTSGTSTTGLECQENIDCPEGQICIDNLCAPEPECSMDEECDDDQYCSAGLCVDSCKPGDGGGGMVEKSYIWVPSENDGTVSKVDTLTLTEVARYRTGPNGAVESGSRTAVSADGRYVVVNGRGTGRSTMIAALEEDCFDLNNDGILQTSQNKDDILPWGTDECTRWSIVHPEWGGTQTNGPRGITWTVGTWNDDPDVCAWENPKVWIGYHTDQPATVHMVEIDGQTGTLDQTVPISNWVGQSGFAPYGGALDPQQRPWFSALRGEIVRINTDQDPVTVSRWTPPGFVQPYGFSVDKGGNPWIGGCGGPVTTFDVETEQWIQIDGTDACHRGVAVDEDSHVWVASNNPCGLVEIDGISRTLIKQHTLGQCQTAIGPSVDVEGHVWLIDQGGWGYKIIDKDVANAQIVTIPGSHYVYSDMTGGQVKSVVPM